MKYIFCIFSCSLKVWFNFCGGHDPKSKSIFKLHKKVIWIISNTGRWTLCRNLSKALNILPVPCKYISKTVCYVKIHIHTLEQNTEMQNHNTCQSSDLHMWSTRTSVFMCLTTQEICRCSYIENYCFHSIY